MRLQRSRGPGEKIYSLHGPEVECISKRKAHKPYEFGVKSAITTTLHPSKGGQFIAHVATYPGSLNDDHTLAKVIPALEEQVGS